MDAFEALADETRRRILLTLAQEPRTAGALAASEVHSRPAVSRHLRVLREVSLVRADVIGRTRVYRLDPSALDPVRTWLARVDELVAGDAGAEHPSPASAAATAGPPIASERFDALDLEVRRALREPAGDEQAGSIEREDIA